MAKQKPSNVKKGNRVEPKFEALHALFDQVPFRGKRGTSKDGGSTWWNVPTPKTCGYFGGIEAGGSAALALMKYYREAININHDFGGGVLQHVVLDMLDGRRSNRALRGQIVGFFSTLDFYLRQASRIDGSLDYMSFESLGRNIADGLQLSDEDHLKKLRQEVRTAAAKQGWETRRAENA